MKYYEVTDAVVTFGIGMVLKLNDKQALARMHALARKHSGLFMVKSPVQFKRGEIIGVLVKGQLTRSLQTRLRLVEDKKTKQPKTPEQKTKADKDSKTSLLKKPQPNVVESNNTNKPNGVEQNNKTNLSKKPNQSKHHVNCSNQDIR